MVDLMNELWIAQLSHGSTGFFIERGHIIYWFIYWQKQHKSLLHKRILKEIDKHNNAQVIIFYQLYKNLSCEVG